MKKRLLVIGAGPFQLPAIEKAKNLGIEVIATDRNPEAPGLAAANHSRTIDINDVQGNLKLTREYEVSGVLTLGAEKAITTVAEIAAQAGLPGLNLASAYTVTNKLKQREALQRAGVPGPWFHCAKGLDQVRELVREKGLPIVMKPLVNSGQRGVSVVEDLDELDHLYERTIECSATDELMVEEFMEGKEIIVESLTYDNKHYVVGVLDRITVRPRGCGRLAKGQEFPSNEHPDVLRKVIQTAFAALDAVNFDFGPSHVELLLTNEGPKIVEINGRLAGAHIPLLVSLGSGFDLIEGTIRLALGEKPVITLQSPEGAVMSAITADGYGVVKKVAGLEAAKQMPGVVEIVLTVKPGDRVRPFFSAPDRMCYVVAYGKTRQEAKERAEAAKAKIEIDVSYEGAN